MTKELWIRASLSNNKMQMAFINNVDGQVMVDQPTLEALTTNTKAVYDPTVEPTWTVNYPVIVELLTMHGFKLWDVE